MPGVGSIFYLVYDARPIAPLAVYKVQVTKETKAGNYKFKNLDAPGKYEDVVLNRDGSVRGWNTLCWRPVHDFWRPANDFENAQAYKEIREQMALQAEQKAKEEAPR